MPSKFLVVDETNDSSTAKVFSNKSLRAAPAYSYVFIPSATATGAIVAQGAGIVHSVVFCDSATATTYFILSDNSTGSAVAEVGLSASAIAVFGTITKNTFILDAIFNQGLYYRTTATALGPTIVTYSAAS